MSNPLAYFLTFRTYGTWLHGDSRGSVDRRHNIYGAPLVAPDAGRLARAGQAMRSAPLLLDEDMRRIVTDVIVEHCLFRKWKLVQHAVRSNHVHVIVGFAGLPPESMAGQLKARATRILREKGLVSVERRVWADGAGSTRYLWKELDVADAVLYVQEYQDRPRE